MARQSRQDIAAASLPVLITRPPGQGARFSRDLALRFGALLRPLEAPLIRPVLLHPELPEGSFSAVILTSETGALAAADYGDALPRRAYCVGERTAKQALSAGLEPVSADGDAEALIAMICRAGEAGPLLHLRGHDSRGRIADRLIAAGIPVIERIVYRQEEQALTETALEVLRSGGPVLVPLFSPRTAEILALQLAGLLHGPLWVVALSPAVAAPVRHLAARLAIAARPQSSAMLDAIGGMLSAPGEAT